MRHILIAFAAVLFLVLPAGALDRVVTIEGPVKIVGTTPDSTQYLIETPDRMRYQVVLPPAEREKLALVVRESPSAVVRFDGTVVNNEGIKTMNVNRWQRVTTTTTTTDKLGDTYREKTTVIEKE